MILRTYKYRLCPTPTQKEQIEQTFGVCRLVYNLGLEIKRDAWRNAQKNISAFELCKQLIDLKKEFPWVADVNAQALQASIKKLDAAYRNFYSGRGFPKFKKRRGPQSFQCPQQSGIDFQNNRLNIRKIKNIPIVVSRKFSGKIKTVTISRSATGKYFASILVETMDVVTEPSCVCESNTVGIDLGVKDFAVTSDGNQIASPRYLYGAMARLKILQRRASKKKMGSKNQKKAYLRVAIQHEKITNKRYDFLQKLSTKLVRDSQATTFCVESLAVKNLVKNHNLAQAISDVSWAEFVRQLEYKCKWYGKNLIKIGRFEPSSKTCSECGRVNEELTLADRKWKCECGVIHDRDINAARNIRKMGLAKYSGRGTPGEPVEQSPTGGAMKRELLIPRCPDPGISSHSRSLKLWISPVMVVRPNRQQC